MPHSQSGCEGLPFIVVYLVCDRHHLHSGNESFVGQ